MKKALNPSFLVRLRFTSGSAALRVALAAAVFSSFSCASSANAAINLVVTTAADDAGNAGNCKPQTTPGTGTDASCSLRDALLAAANGGYDISFSAKVFNAGNTSAENTITAKSTLQVPANTTISGPLGGSGTSVLRLVTISGGGKSSSYSVFTASGTGIYLNNLIITNGNNPSLGGGLATSYAASVTLQNCLLTGNFNGAIWVTYAASVNLNQSVIANNSGEAITSLGNSVTVTGSTISGNNGGISSSGSLTVDSSTISGNTTATYGSGGGILNNGGTLSVTASTINGNTADYLGGGIANSSGTVKLTDTIVAGNSANGQYADFSGSYADGGGNVVGTEASGKSQIAIALTPLGKYGGTTETMLPLPGSPALCRISPSSATGIDQRGQPRTTTYGSTVCQDSRAVQTQYSMAFTTEPPANVNVGQAIAPAPVVQLDESGSLATAADNAVTLSDSSGVLKGTASAPLAKGSATFSDVILSGIADKDILTADLALTSSLKLDAMSSAINAQVAPMLIKPVPGSTLPAGKVSFSWSAGSGSSAYQLALGTSGIGSSDIFRSSTLSSTSIAVPNVPSNGVTVFARLSYENNGTWLFSDYVYAESGTAAPPSLNSPAPGSTLSGKSATFQWKPGVGSDAFRLLIGTTGVGSSDLLSTAPATTTSVTVNNLPTNGVLLLVRLDYLLNGAWSLIDYTYTEAGKAVLPSLVSPAPGSTLNGASATFQWNAGVGSVAFQFELGTTGAGSSDVFSSGSTAATSVKVASIPANGVNLYARLLYLMSGVWKSIDYVYTESGTFVAPALTTPAPGGTLTGTSATFAWNPGKGSTGFEFLLGQDGVGAKDVYSSGGVTGDTAQVSSIPANGVKLYARLSYQVNEVWKPLDYVYTESGKPVPPALTVPTPGSTFQDSAVGFGWTPGKGATAFQLELGSTGVGSSDLYNSGETTSTKTIAVNLPTDGKKVYARLLYELNGAWQPIDYSYTAANGAIAESCSKMSLGVNANLNGFVPFPADNAWNTDISNAPVDPESATITGAAGFAGNHLHPDFSSVNGGDYGIPYVVVDSSQTPLVPVNVIDYTDQSDVTLAPIPLNAPIEGFPADCSGWPDDYVGDSHVLVLDRNTCELYETYNTHRCNGQWNSSSETLWDLNNDEHRPYGWTSADAAGLPIFPGLVRYDEVAAGAINHAIRFTLPSTKDDANGGYFVDPATHAAGNLWGIDNVIGMRIRLRADFPISTYSKSNQVILTAMKKYGMILADNGNYFYFQGTPDARWDDNDLHLLNGIDSSNFDVVQMTPTYPGWDSATAPTGHPPTINLFTASPSKVTVGTPVTLAWNTSNDSYDFIDQLGGVRGGSITITPTTITTYTLNATNSFGRSTASVTVNVTGAAPPITWAMPSPITYGTALSSAELNATAPVPGKFVYNPALGTVLHAGQQTLSVTFTPTDTADHKVATAKVQLTVNQATPKLTWAAPAPIPAGTALNSVQLDASASEPGTFTYNPPAGTVPPAGTEVISATFTPSDNVDYAVVSAEENLTVIPATTPVACSAMSLGQGASLNGFLPFQSATEWNVDISDAPLDPNNAAITSAAGFAGLHLHHDFSSVAGGDYGIPYVVVDSSQTPLVPINVLDYADESDVAQAPFPINAPIEGSPADCTGWPDTYVGDSHVLVLDRAACMLYETFNTHRCNAQWNASSETIWNLKTYDDRPYGWTSADAAGLPIFPGLIRYDEVAAGEIKHAIRFTMQQTKNDANGGYFVLPATHAAGTTWGVSNIMGMRIRLKASFDISGYSKANQVILTAMKKYGMILADNGGYFFFQGVPDTRWDDNDLLALDAIQSSNFEVVEMTPPFPGWDANSAPTGTPPTINSFKASQSTVSAGTPVTLNWSTSHDSYDFIDVLGGVSGGSVTVKPSVTTTYTLNATNSYGRTTAQVTVTVH